MVEMFIPGEFILSNLNDLTIVIPTFDREPVVKRSIRYWETVGVRVLVLDGSDKPLFPDGPLSAESMVSYFSFPRNLNEKSHSGSYFRRMNFACAQVNSEFVGLCADDDFYLKSGLEKAIQLFDDQAEIDSVFRPCADYRITDDGVYWGLEYSGWRDRGYGSSPDVYTRVKKTDRGYINYYSICRVEKWKQLLQLCFEEEFGHIHVNQFLMDELGKILLRTAVLNDLLYVRQWNDPLKYHWDGISLGKWMTDVKNRTAVNVIKTKFGSALSSVGARDHEEKIIADVFSFYSSTTRDVLNKVIAKLHKHLIKIPNPIRIGINRVMPRQISFILGYRGKTVNEHGVVLSRFKSHLEESNVPFTPGELDDLEFFLK
jgi:glycosyltransferase domain-containing protein